MRQTYILLQIIEKKIENITFSELAKAVYSLLFYFLLHLPLNSFKRFFAIS